MEYEKGRIGKAHKKLIHFDNGNDLMETTRQETGTRIKQSVTRKKLTTEHLQIGTWNIRGSYEEGKLKHLVREVRKYHFDIIALQETKQIGNDMTQIEDYLLFNSGGQNRMLGTGFLINNKLKSIISEFKAVSDRLCTLRIQGKYQKITFVNIHAPSEDKDMIIKEQFYNELDTIYERIPTYDLKIVLGDANAKIGQEEIFRPTIGKYSKHKVTNGNGHLLIDFAKEKNMIIKSTYFERKEIHKGTWTTPDGKCVNQIDHVLVEKDEEQSITNIRTYRGPDMDSDHFVVGVKMKQIIPILRNQIRTKSKTKRPVRLMTREEQLKYEKEISKELTNIGESNNIEERWKEIKTGMKVAASKSNRDIIAGHKVWFDDECKMELDKRNKLRLKKMQEKSREAEKRYNEQRQRTKRLMREKKRRHNEQILENIEESYRNNEVRNLYQGTKNLKKGYKSKTICLKDKNGKMLMGDDEILDRWREYFSLLLNEDSQSDENEEGQVNGDYQQTDNEPPPSNEQITDIIKKLKKNKSPGSDEITAEMFKYGGTALIEQMQKLLENIWVKEQLPEEWSEALLCPIYKKGDKSECQNYRGIALLNVAYKILAIYIKDKLVTKLENSLGEYQCGFRRGRSTVDQIFTLREVQAESYEYEKPTLALFIDFKQAFDKVKRKALFKVLQELGISHKLSKMIQLTLQKTEDIVRINKQNSQKFEVGEGVRQGDPLSSLLFSFVLEKTLRDANINRSGLIYQRRHQCLAFADDIVIITRNIQELKETVKRLEEHARKKGLYINENKTKFMQWTDQEYIHGQYLTIKTAKGRTYKFEEVERFEYLGTVFTRKPGSKEEIQKRIMAGNRCVYALNKILKSKSVSRGAKIRIYKSVIRPVVLYASETWTMNKSEQEMLQVWERKVLRKIFGGTQRNDVWAIRTNKEIEELYKEPNISNVIKAQRLRWLGHVQRMPNFRLPKIILNSSIGGRKRRGRPRTRWKNEVEKDMRQLKILEWKRKAMDKKKWRMIVNQAMSHKPWAY